MIPEKLVVLLEEEKLVVLLEPVEESLEEEDSKHNIQTHILGLDTRNHHMEC